MDQGLRACNDAAAVMAPVAKKCDDAGETATVATVTADSSLSGSGEDNISFSSASLGGEQRDNQRSKSPETGNLKTVSDEQEVVVPRRSGRERKSTVIVVNGHTIRKDNNYVLSGMSYKYGVAEEQQRPLRAKKLNAKKALAGAVVSQPKKKPRVQSQLEKDRLQMKESVESHTKEKQAARMQFLGERVNTLRPFCESKVIKTLSERPTDGASRCPDTTTMFLQPEGIQADLRDYQLQGLNWMSNMYANNVGMILGDEMGLGKTLQTISLVCHLKENWNCSGPTLVICPLSVLYSWCSEITKWAPHLKYNRLHNSNTETSLDFNVNLCEYDIVVTTYEMVKAPALKHLWSRNHFNLLVLDEGHKIKGIETQISQAVRKIHCECRLILTGTPLANNLVELYSLLSFLVPDVFSTPVPFEEAFDLQHNQVDDAKLAQAHKLLGIFMLRRLKTEVEKLMPKKIETKVLVPLSNMQIWWYKALLLKDMNILASGGLMSANKSKVLNNLIMQLRKICVHPFLFDGTEEDPEKTTLHELVSASGKLAVLDKLLCSLYRKKHRVVLFSQFTQVLDIIDDYCVLRGWKFCRLDGSTSRAMRNYVVNSFNADGSEKFIFLMSTRSGGMGLNLQTADTCILYDSDWNPQPDCQAMARVHRIGQTKTVHVYRLVCEGTVEERIVERAQKKLYLEKMVTRDGASAEKDMDDEEDCGRLLSALRFGCNAVFGNNQKNALPTDEEIEMITDRQRNEEFSSGKLQGGVDASAKDFDATQAMTATTSFGGIDFKKIREQHQNKPKHMNQISEAWKRQRKSRIKMVDALGSGYGSAAVPVLASNDYDLQGGERSVFAQELAGKANASKQPKRKKEEFESQDSCQVCGDGGSLICCPRCPVSLHLRCAGVSSARGFLCCSHHHCTVCGKSPSNAGGLLFPCSCCPNAYCEDHLPTNGVRFLETCERMEELGYHIKTGVYIHCSKQCEQVAITDYGWAPPQQKDRDPCPLPLDVSEDFGGKVDEFVDVPDGLIVQGKRCRKKVDYRLSGSSPSPSGKENRNDFISPAATVSSQTESPPKKAGLADADKDYSPPAAGDEDDEDDDDGILFVGNKADIQKVNKQQISGSVTSATAFGMSRCTSSNASSTLAGKPTHESRSDPCLARSQFKPATGSSLERPPNSILMQASKPTKSSQSNSSLSKSQFVAELAPGAKEHSSPMDNSPAFGMFCRIEKAALEVEYKDETSKDLSARVLRGWRNLSAENLKAFATLAKQESSTEREYTAVIPVTKRGLFLNLASKKRGVGFICHYRREGAGTGQEIIGPAERAGVFRGNGGLLLAVDGMSLEHLDFKQTLSILKKARGPPGHRNYIVLRMRRPDPGVPHRFE